MKSSVLGPLALFSSSRLSLPFQMWGMRTNLPALPPLQPLYSEEISAPYLSKVALKYYVGLPNLTSKSATNHQKISSYPLSMPVRMPRPPSLKMMMELPLSQLRKLTPPSHYFRVSNWRRPTHSLSPDLFCRERNRGPSSMQSLPAEHRITDRYFNFWLQYPLASNSNRCPH